MGEVVNILDWLLARRAESAAVAIAMPLPPPVAPRTAEEILSAPSKPEAWRATTANGPPPAKPPALEWVDRDTAIARIRKALKARSGKAWSIKGGKGTGWGWIHVCVTEAQAATRPDWAKELSTLLGGVNVYGGVSIPSSSDYYWEYIDRAEGRPPRVAGRPYWD